jgi:hypothetical protein
MPPTQRLPITRLLLAKSRHMVLTATAGQVAKIGRSQLLLLNFQEKFCRLSILTGPCLQETLLRCH